MTPLLYNKFLNERKNKIKKNKICKLNLFFQKIEIYIGDWGLGPIPNPQSPIPNPQSPLYI